MNYFNTIANQALRKVCHAVCASIIFLTLDLFLFVRASEESPTANAETHHTSAVAELSAQQRSVIKGKVVDKSGLPVIGASVFQTGTRNGTVTDSDGNFSISVPSGAILKISCIGYKDLEIEVTNPMSVTLEYDRELLNEVVVVGYGSQKRADITGSVATVDVGKTLDSRPIPDVGRGLQGAVAGMNVRVPTGEVGSDPIISIRGQIGSVNGGNSPLILLDNVEIPSLQMVNPADIESITVLKDAASVAIYGSKAAFGVILVTTKDGTKGPKIRVSYTDNFSWQNVAKSIDIGGIDALQYTYDAQVNRKAAMPAGGFWRISAESLQKARKWQDKWGDVVKWNDPVLYGRDWYFDGTEKYGYRIYDGVKAMIRNWAPSQQHNLSITGKDHDTSYSIGLGMVDQDGMTRTAKVDDFKRYNASFSFTTDVNKYLTLRAGAMYSDRNKRYPGIGNYTADPWLYLYRWSPLFPIGVMERDHYIRESAYEMMAANTDNLRNRYFHINLGATINFTEDWDLKFDYTYDRQMTERRGSNVQYEAALTWYSPVEWIVDGQRVYVDDTGQAVDAGADGAMPAYTFPLTKYFNSSGEQATYVRDYMYVANNNTVNAYSTYHLTLGSAAQHDLKFMLGTNIIAGKNNSLNGKKNDLLVPTNPQFSLATGNQFIDGSRDWSSRIGFFGRVNYSFANKYFLEANLRRDGSHKFPKDLRWKWFPAFSGGWILSNESFMEPVKEYLSFAKFRASWGQLGDQSVSSNLYRSILTYGQTSWLDDSGKMTYFSTPSLVDADITWQMIQTLDLGFDLRFFKNMMGVTFDWYRRDTKDMIIPGESLPSTLGDNAPSGNYGNLRTNGWEITYDFDYRFANGLGINFTASLYDATTKITKGADWATPWEDRLISEAYSTGRRWGDIYGYVTDRLYQRGDFVYDSSGNIVRENVIFRGTLRSTNKQTAQYPVYQVIFEDGNNVVCSPGDVKFKDLNGDGFIDGGTGTNGDHGDLTVIGNSTPRYEYSFRIGADWKGFDFSMFFQGIGKRKIWGAGQLAIPGYSAKEGALPQTFTKDYWYEHYDAEGNLTDANYGAFYPRAWDLGGANTGFTMQVQSKYLLNMAYLRLKNVTIGYSLPQRLLRKVFLDQARVYVSLENFWTWDHLKGLPIDPEAISGYSMFSSSYNLGRTGTGTPVFKSTSVGLQLTF